MMLIALLSLWLQTASSSSPAQNATPQTISDVFRDLHREMLTALPGLLKGALVFTVFYLIARTGARIIALTAPRVHADAGAVLLLSRVYYYGVLAFGSITALGMAGLNILPLVTGLGLTGFALGFALKDVLSNLLSGIMLLIYRPFNIGDQIATSGFEGTIITIRMRDTVLQADDGRLIIIPNTKLITEVVVNNSTAQLVRDSVEVNFAATVNLLEARQLLARAMNELTSISGRIEPAISIKETNDHTPRLEGRFWYDPRRINPTMIRNEVAQAIKRAFEKAGIQPSMPVFRGPQEPKSSGETRSDEGSGESNAASASS
ncbi:MAG: mechanosensitive ion channel family protein [Pyrinomonadaceae bacterium]|nr:mechanosensitive ion channel family protein [Pyrinomonadaceae bacterium]